MGIFTQPTPADAAPNLEQNMANESLSDTTATENLDQNQEADATLTAGTETLEQAEETQGVEQAGDATTTTIPTNEAPAADAADAPAQEADAAIEQTAETNGEPTQQDAAAEGEVEGATESLEDTSAQAAEQTQTLTVTRSASNRAYSLLGSASLTASLARKADDLRQSLRDARLVQGLSQVAQEHNLSGPMVTAFQAIPEFDTLVQSFPGADSFNVVIEHPTSANNVLGLESFSAATLTATDSMKSRAEQVASAFSDILQGLPTTVSNLKAQIAEDRQALSDSDITEEVLASLPVFSLDDQGFNEHLTKLEMYVKGISAFNADEVQANPDKVQEEIQGLQAIVQDLGPAIGMTMDQFGLREADRDAAFEPTQGSFGTKSINGASVDVIVNRASALLDGLEGIAQRKDELVASVTSAIEATPATLLTEDVQYGALDHVTLVNSYTTFVGRLVSESVTAVAMVLSTVDQILNVDTGTVE